MFVFMLHAKLVLALIRLLFSFLSFSLHSFMFFFLPYMYKQFDSFNFLLSLFVDFICGTIILLLMMAKIIPIPIPIPILVAFFFRLLYCFIEKHFSALNLYIIERFRLSLICIHAYWNLTIVVSSFFNVYLVSVALKDLQIEFSLFSVSYYVLTKQFSFRYF